MSDYIIKTYEKGIENEQARVGIEATKDWTNFHQTPAENLIQTYASTDFDPETRIYAFKGDKLIGFMVSKILPDTGDGIVRVQHDIPLAIENPEKVSELLYEKGLEIWKNKGVKVIEIRVSEGWLGSKELAEKYGYKKSRTLYVKTEAALNKIKVAKSNNKFEDFNPERDKEQLIQFFKENFNMNDEQAKTNFDGIVNATEGYYYQPIIREENKIVLRGLVYVPKGNPEVAVFRPLVPEPKKYFDSYLGKITEFAKEKGALKFEVYFGGQALEMLDFYKSHGLEVTNEVFIYEKEI
ncbi:MAG: hypothetical protein JXA54_14620 [Candidatus Heimdallarchaeota archaeon]|nr:hypothetical protein [Candidatus Heimdallarchaeota archaeon]